MIRAAVFFGGRSVEHEISIITALEVLNILDTEKILPIPVYIAQDGRWFTGDRLWQKGCYLELPRSLSDLEEVVLYPKPSTTPSLVKVGVFKGSTVINFDVALPIFHGQFGEDGCMQGLFELADVPYTGCGVLASALSMSKGSCKAVLKAHGIPVLPWHVVEKRSFQRSASAAIQELLQNPSLKYPLFVKPNNLGSSIGIGKGTDEAALYAALANVFRFDEQAIVEPCVTSLFEINISVIEGEEPSTSVVEVPVSSSGMLTYEEKYLRGGNKKGPRPTAQGMASLVRSIDPADLPDSFKESVRNYARRSFELLGCNGVVRFDFIVNKETGDLYLNELNAIPGSLAHYLWAKSKPARLYTENLNQLVAGAFERHARKVTLQRNTGFKALK